MTEKTKSDKSIWSAKSVILSITILVFIISAVKSTSQTSIFKEQNTLTNLSNINVDSVESVRAFKKVYEVLQSPRCLNCHPSGDIPFQGDEGKLHAMYPRRGTDGKGILTMKCTNCHQPENTKGLHTPPGGPVWHLPPANMKMVFEGKSPRDLALQLIDPEKNGHKSMDDLIAHADDSLVRWGWDPGEGRSLPPHSYEEFKLAWITWIEKGAYAPKK